jgi:predicted dehydrogenase
VGPDARALKNSKLLKILDVTACADLVPERADKRAQEFNIPKACSVEELLNDTEIEIILNLTTPDAHYKIARASIDSGKSVYNEKPIAIDLAEGEELVNAAEQAKVLIGGAPDTFMGGGIQTCRKLIDDGWIGEPVAATAFMTCHGHEGWHPNRVLL